MHQAGLSLSDGATLRMQESASLLYDCRSVFFAETNIAGHELHDVGVYLKNHCSLNTNSEMSPEEMGTFILGCVLYCRAVGVPLPS